MRSTLTLIIAFALLPVADATAQLPVATGRQIALSQPQWKLFIPDSYTHRPGEAVDLLVHFHGDPQTVWNNAEYAELNAVVVTANYSGLSSAYSNPFADLSLFDSLLDSAKTTLESEVDFNDTVSWDQLAVSSFSAGYGAVRQILRVPAYRNEIDSLLAADSLYATTAADGTAVDSQMVDYKTFASLAAAGQKRFVFTHTLVQTFTYESTSETGDELLAHLGLSATPTNETGLGPLSFYRKASLGGFDLWGTPGATGEDHLNQLRYLGEWLDDLDLAQQGLTGDFNEDGVVDAADFTLWRDTFLSTTDLRADANGDGFVGNSDYDLWAANFGQSMAVATTVPEPATLILLLSTLAAGSACRR